MRSWLVLLLLGGLARAQEYRFKDAFWGIEYTAPGLRKGLALGDPSLVFRGRCAGGLVVSIRVRESAVATPATVWMKQALARLKARKRVAVDLLSGPDWLHYKHETPAGFWKHQGHAFFVRGLQCFELQVVADRKEATAEIRVALKGLRLHEKAPGTLLVYRIAREEGRAVDDPRILLEAGSEYVTGKRFRTVILPLAAQVLRQARARMKPDTFRPAELWRLYELGGLALHDRPGQALSWHALAEQAASKLPERPAEYARRSAYHLACACARTHRIDEAFVALDRAYEGGKPVSDAQVSRDRDLDNLRRDKRWDRFWREKVKG